MLTKYELKMPHAVYSGEDALGRISWQGVVIVLGNH